MDKITDYTFNVFEKGKPFTDRTMKDIVEMDYC